MSVWAEKWAYEQPVKNAGAKFVLVALAGFADAEGYSFYGQETLAVMTSQTDRTVRSHLKALEEAGFIRREHRYLNTGQRTSDGCYILAPPDRLRPPAPPKQKKPLPENSSGSKRDYRKSTADLPENSSGSLPENSSGELKEHRLEQSEELSASSERAGAREADSPPAWWDEALNWLGGHGIAVSRAETYLAAQVRDFGPERVGAAFAVARQRKGVFKATGYLSTLLNEAPRAGPAALGDDEWIPRDLTPELLAEIEGCTVEQAREALRR